MPSVQIVYYPAAAQTLAPAELEAEFLKLGRNDPLWQALMQLLQERLANATVDAANCEPQAAGRLQEILALQQQLSGYRKGRDARKPGVS